MGISTLQQQLCDYLFSLHSVTKNKVIVKNVAVNKKESVAGMRTFVYTFTTVPPVVVTAQ